jgi:hypothetical protein
MAGVGGVTAIGQWVLMGRTKSISNRSKLRGEKSSNGLTRKRKPPRMLRKPRVRDLGSGGEVLLRAAACAFIDRQRAPL